MTNWDAGLVEFMESSILECFYNKWDYMTLSN